MKEATELSRSLGAKARRAQKTSHCLPLNLKFFLARSELRNQVLRVPYSETKLKKLWPDRALKNMKKAASAPKSAKTWAGSGKTGRVLLKANSTERGGSRRVCCML